MNIYSIHDAAAQYFINPFVAQTDAQATRMFIGSLGESFPHRADFTLHCLGTFDPDTGNIAADPRLVMAGLSIAEKFNPSKEEPNQ
jgi:hypothetical protein